ncbi:hypothetical protein F503_01106 [Ophiostoma piceae UAMH 11346]|uniref:Uncharacterized protein n=1 Tax=Ophiostoma piceae (strain UAMH 11346) TaxID=1262450 RepID=S3CP57_OPHP1|nr:hypothetical protein F503_01106 [Ophiostoma piceae UAMH 11346]
MVAIDTSALIARDVANIAKRSNWAGKEAGVIVVFAIVFVVAVSLTGLFIHKCISKRKASKPQNFDLWDGRVLEWTGVVWPSNFRTTRPRPDPDYFDFY